MSRFSRKNEILQVASACFSEYDVDTTAVEMIRDRSGASIDSLYHHFDNKERIHGELYLAGVGQYVALLEVGFARTRSAEETVRLLAISYTDWVVANPDWARFILYSRGRVEAGELGECLRANNQAHSARIHAALAGYRVKGLFRETPGDCFASVVVGPVHDLVRQWLAGRTRVTLVDCHELLVQMAWDSVRAARGVRGLGSEKVPRLRGFFVRAGFSRGGGTAVVAAPPRFGRPC